MITLARVVVDHAHAVQRDLVCHRLRWDVYGLPGDEKLPFEQFVSFVMGAHPSTALGYAVSEGWSPTDELLANMTEQQAGLIKLTARYQRPGVQPKELPPSSESERLPEEDQPTSAAAARLAVSSGGTYDTFDTPEDFHAKLAAARGELKAETS